MKKKRMVTWIALLMSATLILIIVMQTIHIVNSYKRANEILNRGISEAINRTIITLQKQDVVVFIYNRLNNPGCDSAFPIDPYLLQLGINNSVSQIYGGGFQIEFSDEKGLYKERFRYSINLNDDEEKDYIESFFNEQFTNEKLNFEQIIKQIEQEFFQNRIPIEKRYDVGTISSILKNSLQSMGIDMNFEFAIANESNKIKIKSKGFDSSRISECYRFNLAPTSLFSDPDVFLVDFPDKNKYALNTIYAQVITSVILIMLFILSFSASIYALLKQKKISEIKNDFISNMTHEFKTPLATIKLAVSSLKNEKTRKNPEMLNSMLEIISQETNRMNHHVEQVLQMALLDKQNMVLNKRKVNMNELVAEAIENIELVVAERGGSINLNFCDVDIFLNIDPELMQNAIRNLLDNAIKYSKDAPEISILTYIVNDSYHISIKDNGIGMSKEAQKHIFERFYRAPKGNVHDVKGFGLGLNYVYEIVKAHKGDISVKSAPGKGSTFIISLPLK